MQIWCTASLQSCARFCNRPMPVQSGIRALLRLNRTRWRRSNQKRSVWIVYQPVGYVMVCILDNVDRFSSRREQFTIDNELFFLSRRNTSWYIRTLHHASIRPIFFRRNWLRTLQTNSENLINLKYTSQEQSSLVNHLFCIICQTVNNSFCMHMIYFIL